MYWLPLLVNRLIWLVPTIFGLTTLIFVLSRVVPIDPAVLIAGENASLEQIQEVRSRFGLDEPLPSQFVRYLASIVRGDLGTSLYTQTPILDELKARLPATIELTAVSLAIAGAIGIPTGVICGVHYNSWLDHVLRVVVVASVGVTHFWLAIQLQIIFSMKLGWLPLAGRFEGTMPYPFTGLLVVDSFMAGDWRSLGSALQHLGLPALTIGLPTAAIVQRFTRNSVISMMNSPSIAYQQAMGFSRRIIVWKYLLRSSLAATVALFGLTAGIMLAGVVAVETVFDWPGMGNYAVRSIMYSDYNAVMGFTIFAGTVFAVLSVVVDLVQVMIDPRGAT
ncbi:ABC transporter permease [Rhizobium lentis]|uniref:ABC transporter permease n=1 Tax=Rhizobium lentis TaxID=1138194 RepID=A0ABS7IDG8_9HYPH|nr:ABC transporter permease [Rhizobium lentis]MBX5088366.1 ABC transporter permease [Rhizobium lentis]